MYGRNGTDGRTGSNGRTGTNGRNGTDGRTGTNGRNGIDGRTGTNGRNGIDGRTGIDGHNGINGHNGIDGRTGTNGRNGIDGHNGIDGDNGVNGKEGKQGKEGKEGEDADVKFVSVKVPVCQCFQNAKGEWETKKVYENVKAISNKAGTANNALTIIGEYEELFKSNYELCLAKNKEMEAYASVPDYWQTRSFQKPQLAIQYAENLGNGKIGRSRWTLYIPHYNKPKEYEASFPKYEKGDYRGILVLNDNSKIIVHCKSEPECLRVINALKHYVDPFYLKNIKEPETTKGNEKYKQVSVIPTLCQFFPKGQKDTIPLWSKKLRKRDS